MPHKLTTPEAIKEFAANELAGSYQRVEYVRALRVQCQTGNVVTVMEDLKKFELELTDGQLDKLPKLDDNWMLIIKPNGEIVAEPCVSFGAKYRLHTHKVNKENVADQLVSV